MILVVVVQISNLKNVVKINSMKKIKTAENFLKNKVYITKDNNPQVYHVVPEVANVMIKFAQLHVQAALEAAGHATLLYDFKQDIIDSYPLSNIK